MMDDTEHHIEPVTSVEVASLLVTCGMCGASVLIEYEALDQDKARVDPAEDYLDCPECDHITDAQAVTFSAHLITTTSQKDA